MQPPQKQLILYLLSRVVRKVFFTHSQDGLVEGSPVKFFYQFLDIIGVELSFLVDGLLDFNREWEAVLLALRYVADKKIVGNESHNC